MKAVDSYMEESLVLIAIQNQDLTSSDNFEFAKGYILPSVMLLPCNYIQEREQNPVRSSKFDFHERHSASEMLK